MTEITEPTANNPMQPILVVDDDEDLLTLIAMRLRGAGYQVDSTLSSESALGMIEASRPQLLITDMRMDGMDGMALFKAVRAKYPALPVIILTAHGTIPDAINATKQGVFSYLTKPFNSQELLENVAQALRLNPTTDCDPQDAQQLPMDHEIIYRSNIMKEVLLLASQVAQTDVSVFINSQSGTGKELLAKAIHHASDRSNAPFIAVNCAAIPETLLESELFGHVKGSFTGANKDHLGLFQAADGGTLFLDEIGDMPLSFQVKLLRVLQEKEVRRVGDTQSVSIDVRVISATHKDLEQAVEDKEFREDLFYRLNVVELRLPSLAERRDDIPLLVNYFFQQILQRIQKPLTGYTDEAMALLIAAPWPGNVRQLQNVVEQTVALSQGPLISGELVQRALRMKSPDTPSLSSAKNDFERAYLAELLNATLGNVTQAAKIAGRNRTEFYKLLDKHHLKPEQFR
ncbi:sigma-54-dependent transcriptional regulator [Planctobacterium marinum]|uniref:sigma-54-dependent transcriptional regulator n=1 Tax=Planctobacterium marinum TaxID=1631968 RepID=UPI001E5203A4|nr:sigma-54 dependent transcriptional regulator [Planctobacterium marinum]MCC2603763.1 sigma-54 dependent transcriptional regulator [Planctobacterium marinum]